MYKQNLALNNPQELICHKIQPNHYMTQSIGAAEYIDYISAER